MNKMSEKMKDRLMKPWQVLDGNKRFLEYYRCLNFSESQASHNLLDNSNKVVLPQSAFDRLKNLHVDFPWMFSVHPFNESFFDGSDVGTTHCAVSEFTAEEGFVHMPRWMMSRLGLEERDLVFFTNSMPLAKGARIKIQPHKTDFLNLSDHKTVLEIALRSYSCLTTGDAISMVHNNREYMINIVETVPEPAVSLIDTDCEVDFEAPVDYEEVMSKRPKKKAKVDEKKEAKVDEEKEKSKFVGTARRLDGSIVPPPPPPEEEGEETRQCSRKSGTLVFGHKTQDREPGLKKQDKETSPPVEPVKFQAFTGAKRTIR